ncbi:MAG: hypothetical protein H7Y11_04845 [Armatimonadetes bacterium]|nr:hypothetical protein [Anaerolineae bacterium]
MSQMTTPERALKDALKFTDDDLAANRQGALSAAQRQTLARRALLMLAITLGALLVFYLSYSALPDASFGNVPPLSLAIMPVALAVTAFGAFELFGTFIKVQRGSVSVAKGKAEIEVDTASRRRLFGKLKVQKFEMFVPKEQLAAFHAGDTYAIYYTSYPRQVLSAEFIKGG